MDKIKKLEQFYTVSQTAELVGRTYRNDFEKELREENPHNIRTYRWNDSLHNQTKVMVPESEVNRLRAIYNMKPPVHTEIEDKTIYTIEDVHKALGVHRITMKTLEEMGIIHFDESYETLFTQRELRRWFGQSVLSVAGLEDKKFYSITEVAAAMRTSERKLQGLVKSGDLKALPDSHVNRRYTISRRNLLRWINHHESTYENTRTPRWREKQRKKELA